MKIIEYQLVAAGKKIFSKIWMPDCYSSKRAIVLLHEGLGSSEGWGDFPEQLARITGRSVFSYDRHGYGKSEVLNEKKDKNFMHFEAKEVLPEVLENLQIEKPVIFGHSDGGSIGLIYAALFPENISGLITEAAHVFVEPETVTGIEKARKLFDKGVLKEKLIRQHGKKIDNVFNSWADIWTSEEFGSWNIEEMLRQIRCPVLAVQGAQDQYGSEAQLLSIGENCVGSETMMLDNCAHIPHKEQRDVLLEKVDDFLKRL